jgi:isopenicillin N synthase-like dioxygenase
MSKNIPVIDISNFGTRKNEIREQLMAAAVDVGFFVVVGHGIPQELVDEQFSIANNFFQLPDDVKAKYAMPKGRNAGWEKMAQVTFSILLNSRF